MLLGCVALAFAASGEAPRVETRKVPDSGVPGVRIEGTIRAPPADVYRIVSEYERFGTFVPYVELSRTVARRGDLRWVHQRLRLPGPAAAREYVLRIAHDSSEAARGRFRVTWRLAREVPGGAPEVDGVRPERFTGSWALQPGPRPATTHAAYTVHMEPGGLIPDWLAAHGIRRLLPRVFRAARARAEDQAAHGRVPGDG